MQTYRQGDVLLIRVRRVPKSATRQETPGPVVLAHGEVTGHAHTVEHATVSLDEGSVMYLTVEQVTEVHHQEHAALTLEPGSYKVTRQREYTPAEIRNVTD